MASNPDDASSYTPEQQRFALNMMANVVGDSKGTQKQLEDQFFATVNRLLPDIAGGWELGFGPVVYKTDDRPDTPPVNAWFVATSKSQQISVLAVAGTAPRSVNGWVQDFTVERVVDWRAWVSKWSSAGGISKPTVTKPSSSSTPYIALGTANGTYNVLNLPSSKASPNTKVYQYLSALPAGYTVYVTGHSMGGALSPVVGLGLVQGKLLGNRKVIVLPSAGASPGNTAFSKLWTGQFPSSGSGLSAINADFYNTKDIVPQAWCLDPTQDRNVDKIAPIFGGKPPFIIMGVIVFIRDMSKLSGIDYLGIPGAAFTSDIPVPVPTLRPFEVFHEQHVIAYQKEAGVDPFVKKFKDEFQAPDGISDSWAAAEGDEEELKKQLEDYAANATASQE